MQYLAWRVLTGLNNRITLSFLIVGHTKLSPDWCFGLFKQVFRRSKVGCLDDIARVVEKSTVVNHAQLVGTQDGEVIVPTYDWAQFFDQPFRQKALKGIKALHHLTFTRSHRGSVFVRDRVSSSERKLNSFKMMDGLLVPTTSLQSSRLQDCLPNTSSTCSRRYGSLVLQTAGI